MPRTRSVAWSELKLGIVGLAAIALATAMVFAIGGEAGFFTERHPLKTQFADVQGLRPGAIVRLNGKEVGTVTAVDFAGPIIDVSLEILTEVRGLVTTESTASVGSLSLLGEPIIDVRATGTGTPLPAWAYIRSGGPGGPFGDLTATASDSLEQAALLISDMREGRGTLGKLVSDDALYAELRQFVGSAARVTEAINEGQGTLGAMIKDPAAHEALKGSLENLQTLTGRINAGEGALGRFLNDEAMGESLAGTLSGFEELATRASSGDGTMAKLLNESELHDRLNGMIGRIDALMLGLEEGKGTAGSLLQDKQLYESINGAVSELQALLADVRADPKKYLRVSVSIF